ncbi:selenoprotein H-like [Uranotaenia lowii]|uniref:selenoprotein H-like n=1 Tax=Uranotaenia lowii TaxID=190385 RepID=UPI00247AE9B0|nr:selenoprotein H-like [Uranotaenia lowii]
MPKKKGKDKTKGKNGDAKSEDKPKKPKGGGKKGKKKVDKNLIYCDDKHFDPNLVVITVEHCIKCFVYREQSEKFFKVVCEAFPDRKFKLIQNDFDRLEAREGAFELSFSKNCRSPAIPLWSGIDLGPPRREKFPVDYTPMIEKIDKEINVHEKPIIKFT